jgi:hypothetical protein
VATKFGWWVQKATKSMGLISYIPGLENKYRMAECTSSQSWSASLELNEELGKIIYIVYHIYMDIHSHILLLLLL